MKTFQFAILLQIILSCGLVLGGDVSVKFAEDDFSNHEDDPSLDVTLVVTGDHEFRDIVLEVEALTVQEFRDRSIACQAGFEIPNLNDGETADLISTTARCTRAQNATGSDVTCSFAIAEDMILEGTEVLVLILRFVDDGGNVITILRNCAIGRILSHTTERQDLSNFNLIAINETLVLTEGAPAVFIDIMKDFETDLPVRVTYSVNINNPPDAEFYNTATMNVDYKVNDAAPTNYIEIAPEETFARLKFEAIGNEIPETSKFLVITFSSRIDVTDVLNTNLGFSPSRTEIRIDDNDGVVTGFNRSEVPEQIITTESDLNFIKVCAILLEPATTNRDVEIEFTFIDGTAIRGTDYQLIELSPSDVFSRTFPLTDEICARVLILNDDELTGTRSFTIQLVDRRLPRLNPAERERWMQFNVIDPGTVTFTILDDEAVPLQPTIEISMVAIDSDGELSFSWEVDEQDGLRPVDCHNGTITELIENENTNSDQITYTRGEEVKFDNCLSGDEQERKQQDYTNTGFDTGKTYEIVVCSQNQVGLACSDPVVYIPPPPAMVGLTPGAIAGIIIVLLLLLLLCCVLLIVLLLCVRFNGWKTYSPQYREKRFAAMRHPPHTSVQMNPYDEVKYPLE